MKTIKDELFDPALRAMIELSQNNRVIVAWEDGGAALIYFDTFMPADETHDGSEQAIFSVDKILGTANSTAGYSEGNYAELSSNNPPTRIFSPDRTLMWVAGKEI